MIGFSMKYWGIKYRFKWLNMFIFVIDYKE